MDNNTDNNLWCGSPEPTLECEDSGYCSYHSGELPPGVNPDQLDHSDNNANQVSRKSRQTCFYLSHPSDCRCGETWGKQAPEGRYLFHCYECDRQSGSDFISKAASDADWHDTMTGHNCEVYDDETDSVVYQP